MKCLLGVALFCIIAIVSAGAEQSDGNKPYLLHRLKRQGATSQSFSSSSSSSSSSTQQGNGPVMFQQTSSSFNSFIPNGGVVTGSSNSNTGGSSSTPDLLQDRFGPDDDAGNNQASSGNNQGFADTQGFPNLQFSGPFLNYPAFQGQNQYQGFGQSFPNQLPNQGQVSGGHFSSVSGSYDPNTQQTHIHQNIHQKI